MNPSLKASQSTANTNEIFQEICTNGVLACKSWSRWEKLNFEDAFNCIYFHSPFVSPLFNTVMEVQTSKPPSQEALIWACKKSNELKTPFVWLAPQVSKDNDFTIKQPTQFESLHFSHVNTTAALALNTSNIEARKENSNYKIQEVSSASDLKQWSKTLLNTYGFAEEWIKPWFQMHQAAGYGENSVWKHFIVYEGKRAITTGSLFLGPHSSSIANVSVHPSKQGQGLGRHMVSRLIEQSQLASLPLITLFASSEAEALYQSFGFKKYGALEIFHSPVDNSTG